MDHSRSCGGSSGGEAGLVASNCVPIGLGTDLGGSIRIPSDFLGLYGFKATSHRVPFSGTRGLLTFNPLTTPGGRISPTIGPLCKSMRDVVEFTRFMFHPEVNVKFDDYTPPLAFREDLYFKAKNGKGLRVGICESLPTFPASQINIEAVRQAKAALLSHGFEVVDFQLPASLIKEYRDIFSTLVANYSLIPTQKTLKANYEGPIPQNKGLDMLLSYGSIFRFMFKTILSMTGNKRFREGIEPLRQVS